VTNTLCDLPFSLPIRPSVDATRMQPCLFDRSGPAAYRTGRFGEGSLAGPNGLIVKFMRQTVP